MAIAAGVVDLGTGVPADDGFLLALPGFVVAALYVGAAKQFVLLLAWPY